jgi:hypothetical protein
MAKFMYLGGTETNQNCTHEEITSRLNIWNAWYHSVQNLLYPHLPSKNLKVKIYKTIILPVVLYGCESWSLTQREGHILRVFKNRMLKRRMWQEAGEDFIMRSSIICTFHQILLG